MSHWKSILVHADTSPHTAMRLGAASDLARVHDASVEALYAVLPIYMRYPYSLSISVETATMLQQVEDDRSARARRLFAQATEGNDRPVSWASAEGDPARAFARAGMCHDLMVLGQQDPEGELRSDVPADFVESVIIASGMPALLIPHIHAGRSIGRNVLVAWKSTREAARALNSSLPLLQAADKVHVAMWNASGDDDGIDRVAIECHLRRHGVRPEVHGHGPESREVGEYLLSLACDVDADMIVMGCYGHSRGREWAMGGATRSVLQSMTVPVLMVH